MPQGGLLKTMLIGDALQELRTVKEVTQEELAKKAGLSINFLSQVENGKKGMSQETAERISRVLGVPPSFLYLLADSSNNKAVGELKEAVRLSLALKCQVS